MPSQIALRHRLQTRMIFSIVTLLALLMLITTSAGIRRERQGIFEQMSKDGVALARAYALSAENALLLKKAGLGRVTGEASRTRNIRYLEIIDQTGRIVGHTDVLRIGTRVENDPLYRKALHTPITAVEQGNTVQTLVVSAPGGGKIFRVVIPLVILDRVEGVLELGLDMTSIDMAVARTNRQSLIIGLLAFGVGGCYVWFFARSLTRPIKKLVLAADRVAAGDLAQEIKVQVKDEIGHLAMSFNNMTKELKDYTDNLKRTNAQLETDAATIEKLRRYTENILASIKPGVIAIDLTGRITTINRAAGAILAVDGREAVGRILTGIFPPDHALGRILAEAAQTRQAAQGLELTLCGDDSREILLMLNISLLYDQASEVMGIAAAFEDVTEIRSLQKRIHEAEKLAAMGELAVGVAHEVRNPLGSLKTSAQFLAAKFTPGDASHKLTQLIIREVDRLNQLVERLLDFTRPAEKDLEYEDIQELLEKALALAMLKADGKLLVERRYAAQSCRLFVDAKRLHQAFLNVMLNALDAMPEGGRLTVATIYEPDGPWLRIEFTDTGEGIPKEKLDKVFTPFFTTRRQGTGLGLAIVQQIMTEHNGAAVVQSQVNKGTTVILRLPAPAGRELQGESVS